MKQRFTSLDVRCVVADLRPKIVGMRLVNIYDVNPKTYIFKFARNEEKVFVLIESGIRMHSTEFFREKNQMPSNFTMKLRKHVRTRRLMNLTQLGNDRIVDFDFTGGQYGFHVFVEFYASGNVILTDDGYSIMTLLRVVQPNEEQRFAVRELYNVGMAQHHAALTEDALRACLAAAAKAGTKLEAALASLEYGPALIKHIVARANLNGGAKVSEALDELPPLLEAFAELDEFIAAAAERPSSKGYIVLKNAPAPAESAKAGGTDGGPTEFYEDVWPFVPAHLKDHPLKEMPSFDAAVDEFFSRIEGQKQELKVAAQIAQANKKVEAARRNHEEHVEALAQAQLTNAEKGQLIEYNLNLVDDALKVIRSALATGMSWKDLRQLVKEEKAKRNPVAMAIDQLKLETNKITLRLRARGAASEPPEADYDDSDEDEEDRPPARPPASQLVDVDLALSAYANARVYFDLKRQSAEKHSKTIAASEKVMKAAERKAQAEIKQTRTTPALSKMRKPYWFEKFLWFISSENYVVIAGRDAQQNELLVKRYLRPGDAYVHADIHGAATVIVKNPHKDQPIPPSTLQQAGTMAICYSSAWDSKVVIGAWWVESHQVSKTAPTGEYLTTGSFMIRGKKNYLPPTQLVMGFAMLFRVDDASIGNHLHERRPRTEQEQRSDKYALEEEARAAEREDGEDGEDGDAAAAMAELALSESDAEAGHASDGNDSDGAQAADEFSGADGSETPSAATTPAPPVPPALQAHGARPMMSPLLTRLTDLADVRSPPPIASANDADDEESSRAMTPTATAASDDDDDSKDAAAPADEFPDVDVQPAVLSALRSASAPSAGSAVSQAVRAHRQSGSADDEGPRGGKGGKGKGGGGGKGGGKGRGGQQQPAQQPPSNKPLPRGQRSKLRKIKTKYKDQDEEDRELMMQITAPVKKPSGKQAGAPAKGGNAPPPAAKKPGAPRPPRAEVAHPSRAAAPAAGGDDGVELPSAVRAGTPIRHAQDMTAAEREEIRRMMAEEKVVVLDEDEMAQLTQLDALTGQPKPEDVLLFALPMCAPYSALANYKYRVKLTPGTQKKGKAAKMALTIFTKVAGPAAIERDLMRAIPENDLFQHMMSKVKLSAPNLEKIKHARRGSRSRPADV